MCTAVEPLGAAAAMGESLVREDPLTRIQREIVEVREREREFKEGHPRMGRLLSESALAPAPRPAPLPRSTSAAQLPQPQPQPQPNGHYARRYAPQPATKGLMQRFIAARGRLPAAAATATVQPPPHPLTSPVAPFAPLVVAPAIARTPEGRPLRKGYVPVEEKIQRELQEMKDREHELRRMRRRRPRPGDLALPLSDHDDDTDSDGGSDCDCDSSEGVLRGARSVSELYAERSPSPDAPPPPPGALKPAKSLAELCDLAPGQEFLAPSSTRLIQQWESIIQQKQEAGA